MLQHGGYTGVLPQRLYGLTNAGVQVGGGICADVVVLEVLHVVSDLRGGGLDVELVHGADQPLGALEEVFVDGDAVHGQFLDGVSILVDDLHLFHDCRLAALSGS